MTANQFLSQIPEIIRYAIIGNVCTVVAFRIGAFDAPILSSELGISKDALINLQNHEARVKRIDHGSPTEAVQLRTILAPASTFGRLHAVANHTRNRHARRRSSPMTSRRSHSRR